MTDDYYNEGDHLIKCCRGPPGAGRGCGGAGGGCGRRGGSTGATLVTPSGRVTQHPAAASLPAADAIDAAFPGMGSVSTSS